MNIILGIAMFVITAILIQIATIVAPLAPVSLSVCLGCGVFLSAVTGGMYLFAND